MSGIMTSILQRVTMPWTFQRLLYVALGSWMVVQSIADGQWSWSIFGAYFASMGIFSFGCAAGCGVPMRHDQVASLEEPEFHVIQQSENTKAIPTHN